MASSGQERRPRWQSSPAKAVSASVGWNKQAKKDAAEAGAGASFGGGPGETIDATTIPRGDRSTRCDGSTRPDVDQDSGDSIGRTGSRSFVSLRNAKDAAGGLIQGLQRAGKPRQRAADRRLGRGAPVRICLLPGEEERSGYLHIRSGLAGRARAPRGDRAAVGRGHVRVAGAPGCRAGIAGRRGRRGRRLGRGVALRAGRRNRSCVRRRCLPEVPRAARGRSGGGRRARHHRGAFARRRVRHRPRAPADRAHRYGRAGKPARGGAPGWAARDRGLRHGLARHVYPPHPDAERVAGPSA